MSGEEPLIRLPADIKLKEETLGDPIPTVITDFILPDSKNAFLHWLPVIVWGIFGLIGIIVFFLTSADGEGMSEWVFYIAMLIVSPYLLKYIKRKINETIEYAHKVTEISKEEHLKLKRGFLGPFGTLGFIAVIIFTVLFGLYDYNGLWFSSENWLGDIIKPINFAFYANGTLTVPFLILWEFGWIFISQFLWYAIGFVIYVARIVPKYNYREEPQVVVKLGLEKPLSHLIVNTGLGFVPFLILRFFLQFVIKIFFRDYDIWWSDTIATTLMLVLFVLVTILPPLIISNDLKKEVAEETRKAEILGVSAIEDVVEKARMQGGVPVNEAVAALLFNSYLQQLKMKQNVDSGIKKKMATSAAGPVASYGAKEGVKFLPPS